MIYIIYYFLEHFSAVVTVHASLVILEKQADMEVLLYCFVQFRTGSSFPHVVDVDWRLDYYIKVKNMEVFVIL